MSQRHAMPSSVSEQGLNSFRLYTAPWKGFLETRDASIWNIQGEVRKSGRVEEWFVYP